jgi:hypothetical protein
MTSETAVQPPSQRWGARRTLAAAGVAAVIGGVGGAAIYAATEGSASTTGSGPHFIGGPAHAGPPPSGPHPAPMAPTSPVGALHSEYVVADGHGGFTTKLTQTGTVDEVTLSSVVVRSDDGYTQIYGFPSSAAGPTVAASDTVTVDATRTGPTVTLTSIGEGPPHGN